MPDCLVAGTLGCCALLLVLTGHRGERYPDPSERKMYQ